MSDLISRATLLKALRKEQRECEKDGEEFGGESILFAEAFGDVIDMVKTLPTVDAVPVVRCKYCVNSCNGPYVGLRNCRKFRRMVGQDSYCSCGITEADCGEDANATDRF